jgi:hypothetical protein
MVQQVFSENKTSAAAANALSEYFLSRGTYDKVSSFIGFVIISLRLMPLGHSGIEIG